MCSWKSTEHLNSNFWKFVSSKPNIFIHLIYQYQVQKFLLPHKKIPKWEFHQGKIPYSCLKKKLISARKCLFITEEISNFSSIRSYYKISTKYLAKDVHQYIQYNILFKQCFFLQRNLWGNRVFFLTLNFHLTDCHQASVFSIAMHFITIFFAPNVKGFTCKLLEEIYLNKRV